MSVSAASMPGVKEIINGPAERSDRRRGRSGKCDGNLSSATWKIDTTAATAERVAQAVVDGVLIGGVRLPADQFLAIIRAGISKVPPQGKPA